MTTDDLATRLRSMEVFLMDGGISPVAYAAAERIEELEALIELLHPPRRWDMGAFVKKKSGAKWHGCVVGFYSTDLTPIGYCVASAFEENSVQIYPENALEDWHV